MKILFIVNSSVFFNSHFLTLAETVAKHNADVYIAAGDDRYKLAFENLGFTFLLLKLSRGGKNIFFELKSLYSIYQVISNVQPDILHLFTIKPIIYGGLVNKLLRRGRVPLSVASITGLGSAYLSANLSGKFLWQLIKQAYKFVLSIPTMKIVFENSDDKQMFIDARIINERQAFLVNGAGVNISYFHPLVEKTSNLDLTVVLVARLLKDKGIREYIEAGKIIKEHGVEITLKLVGSIDNDNSSTMQEDDIVEAHNLGYIQYLGHRSDIANIYRQSQIACLPSYREGLPKSLIEAMACGLPIITTDVPGCRQMIHNGRCGVAVPVKDSNALATAIINLAQDHATMQRMGRESRIVAEQIYSYESIMISFLKIYNITPSSELE